LTYVGPDKKEKQTFSVVDAFRHCVLRILVGVDHEQWATKFILLDQVTEIMLSHSVDDVSPPGSKIYHEENETPEEGHTKMIQSLANNWRRFVVVYDARLSDTLTQAFFDRMKQFRGIVEHTHNQAVSNVFKKEFLSLLRILKKNKDYIGACGRELCRRLEFLIDSAVTDKKYLSAEMWREEQRVVTATVDILEKHSQTIPPFLRFCQDPTPVTFTALEERDRLKAINYTIAFRTREEYRSGRKAIRLTETKTTFTLLAHILVMDNLWAQVNISEAKRKALIDSMHSARVGLDVEPCSKRRKTGGDAAM